ncbi:P-type conjugative transfer protein TrbL, partial [Rathayibacter sp. AY1A4]
GLSARWAAAPGVGAGGAVAGGALRWPGGGDVRGVGGAVVGGPDTTQKGS